MKTYVFTFFFTLIQALATVVLYAKSYYLSESGNDHAQGTSIALAWKSIDRLNRQNLKPGDTIFFRRGDSFEGEILVQFSGTSAKPIVYCAFGSGENPIVTGAVRVTRWNNSDNKYYSADISQRVTSLYCNKKLQTLARYPNKGFLSVDSGNGEKLSFYDFELWQDSAYWLGANIRFKAFDWEWRTSTITHFVRHLVKIAEPSSNVFETGWGYYFDNKISELDTIGEWFYSDDENKIYFIPEQLNISDHNIEACIFENGLTLAKSVSNITISDLQFTMYEANGILAMGNNQNINIFNNCINNITVNGIFIDKLSTSCKIENNTIKQIHGRGIYAIEPVHLSVIGNTISQIGLIPGYGVNGVNGMVGIAISNTEEEKNETSTIARYNTISNNKLDEIGYVGIRMDGSHSILQYNEVSNVMINLSDGSAIYCWAKGKNYTYNNLIRNNIVYNAIGNGEATPTPKRTIANGIYVDNCCYNITVEANSVFHISGSGILINSDAYNNSISKNTIYDCGTGFTIAEWAKPGSTYGNTFFDNIIFCKSPDQTAVELSNWVIPTTSSLGILSKNSYYQFFEKYYLKESYLTGDKEEKRSVIYTFDAWKEKTGHDKDGCAYHMNSELSHFSKSKILFNSEDFQKVLPLNDTEFYNLKGERIYEIQLIPYSSEIVLLK